MGPAIHHKGHLRALYRVNFGERSVAPGPTGAVCRTVLSSRPGPTDRWMGAVSRHLVGKRKFFRKLPYPDMG